MCDRGEASKHKCTYSMSTAAAAAAAGDAAQRKAACLARLAERAWVRARDLPFSYLFLGSFSGARSLARSPRKSTLGQGYYVI